MTSHLVYHVMPLHRRLFPAAGMLLRKLLRQGGSLELPPPHRPGEGAAVLQQLIGDRMPTCLTPEQVIACQHQLVRTVYESQRI